MIAKQISEKMIAGSLIRKMFEEGNRLKALHGPENVFDFSIGNPDLPPPNAVFSTIEDICNDRIPGIHGYMSNSGYLSTRTAIAEKLEKESGIPVRPENICMTVGAAGAINAALKSVLDPGDEVIVLAPFFSEYIHYIENHSGVPVVVSTVETDFLPDIQKIRDAVTPRTKALIINSPNNPTGVVYDEDILRQINDCMKEFGRIIHIISDEPYKELIYDNASAPDTLRHIDNLIVCYSWSKSLSLPGERIGYAAVSPSHTDVKELSDAIVFCNRISGSVNAPAFFQRVIEKNLYEKSDIQNYEKRRNLLFDIVTRAGFSCRKPQGALYLFPKSPVNDQDFAALCARYNLLLVPGSAFAAPGYFRLAFCVSEDTIIRSEKAFRTLGKELNLIS